MATTGNAGDVFDGLTKQFLRELIACEASKMDKLVKKGVDVEKLINQFWKRFSLSDNPINSKITEYTSSNNVLDFSEFNESDNGLRYRNNKVIMDGTSIHYSNGDDLRDLYDCDVFDPITDGFRNTMVNGDILLKYFVRSSDYGNNAYCIFVKWSHKDNKFYQQIIPFVYNSSFGDYHDAYYSWDYNHVEPVNFIKLIDSHPIIVRDLCIDSSIGFKKVIDYIMDV